MTAAPSPSALPPNVPAPGPLGHARRTRSPRHLADLAVNRSVAVRLAVAGNPATPSPLLQALVMDPVPAVRFTAGLHLLERLVSSPAALEVAEVLWADGWTIPIEDGDLTLLAYVAEQLVE